MYRCEENVEKFKLGVGLQLLWPGMPFIYYGDEYGMTGGNDPDCRRGMVWDESYQNKEIYAWYQNLIQIRKAHPVITEGRIKEVFCDDTKGLFAITRELDGKELTLLVHVKAEAIELSGERKFAQFVGMENLLTNQTFSGNLSTFELALLQKK